MLITIEEKGEKDGVFEAGVSFDNQGEHDVIIQNPFDEKQERLLEWYFEEWLTFPFTNTVLANDTAKSIETYGEKLFEQVFGTRHVFSDYQKALEEGAKNLRIEVIGSPAFHGLHWECLRDPDEGANFTFAVDSVLVRKPQKAKTSRTNFKESSAINLLLVTARPNGKYDVGYRTISRPLVEMLDTAALRVNIDILRPASFEAFVRHLESTESDYYQIVHFDMHGSLLSFEEYKELSEQKFNSIFFDGYARGEIEEYEDKKAFLSFEPSVKGKEVDNGLVETEVLAKQLVKHNIHIVILNACQSGKQVGTAETSLGSRLVQAGVHTVLAMGYSVTVSAAKVFMKQLYSQFLTGNTKLSEAMRLARLELYNVKIRKAYMNQEIKLEDWMLPVVYQRQELEINLREETNEERIKRLKRKTTSYQAKKLDYGFVGRDVDILSIEKLLLQHNILLIRGMGGAGKTTLLHHLGYWWQKTGFIDEVFYFGYDEKPHRAQTIVRDIAKELDQRRKFNYRAFEDLVKPELQEEMLVEYLRAHQHLLILDNLESIQGEKLAILNTLPEDEQENFKSFLTKLVGGKAFVLLGSRSSEEWLKEATFADSVYNLPGLDAEAASDLADKVLNKYNVTHYQKAEEHRDDFNQLLKLLAGYPLPIEVVLASLANQTPKEVLTALSTGDQAIDFTSEEKTKSILKCIEYSHGNLNEAEQRLLLCLSPFQAVVGISYLNNYINQLKKVFSELPSSSSLQNLTELDFDKLPIVIQKAQNWGLLTPHPALPKYFLSLQPTLPYFLRNRLQQEQELLEGINAAFREHMEGVGSYLHSLMESKEPQERQMGQILAKFEFENLWQALVFSIETQASILNTYSAISVWARTTHNHRLNLEIGNFVRQKLGKLDVAEVPHRTAREFIMLIANIGELLSELKSHSEAKEALGQAIDLMNKVPSLYEGLETFKGGIYHNLGVVSQRQRHFSEATQYFQQALDIYKKSDYDSQALTYHQLGMVAQGQRQFVEAIKYYQHALDIYIKLKDSKGQALTYNHLGMVAQEQQQFSEAIKYYWQALDIYIKFNDHYNQSLIHHNLGIVAQEQHQYKEATQYYQQALELKIELEDRHSQASTYHQLGIVAEEQRQYEEATQYLQQALELYVEFNDRHSQASTYHNLGVVAQGQRQFAEATQYLQQALELFIGFNDRHSQASTYAQLGLISEQQEKSQEAVNYLLQALERFAETGDNHNFGNVVEILKRLYQATNNENILKELAKVLGVSSEEVQKQLSEL